MISGRVFPCELSTGSWNRYGGGALGSVQNWLPGGGGMMGSGVREVLSAMSTLFLQASRWQTWWHSTWAVKAVKAQHQLCHGSLPPKRYVATKQRLCLWGTVSIVNENNWLRSSGIVTVIQRILRNQELQDLRSSLGFFLFFLVAAGWGVFENFTDLNSQPVK